MRIAYFDCFSGISGDMTVGALLSAGLPLSHLQEELKKLDLDGYSVGSRTLERSMIAATKFDVHLHAHEQHRELEASHSHGEHGHSHDHNHSHDHSHHHHSHDDSAHNEQHVHEHGLSYAEITTLIGSSRLPDAVKHRSQKIFRPIAEAEAVIHGVTLDTVHFHEVGAIDSIVDIVATAIGLEDFGIEECRSRVVPLGAGGFVRTAHGKMPIPTPATLAILAGYPTELGNVHSEMTTPTGAGIIKALSGGVLQTNETLHVEAIGYGAGTKEFLEQPNLLRLVIGELDTKVDTGRPFPDSDTVAQLTACIDDMPPTQLAYVQERLMDSGALDAYLRPIVMKKGRAAQELVILCEPERTEEILALVARETTTIGIRTEEIRRRKAMRSLGQFEHPQYGAIRIKTIESDNAFRREPEFEEVKRISRERGLPFLFVLEQIRKDLQ